jgi:4-hydroxybenzoate polyprenyltransferase
MAAAAQSTWLSVVRLLRWDKPAGRLILMIPALWAVLLASRGRPDPVLIGVIVLGTLATSGAGCVVNDLWDRNLDPQVERTRERPLASRALSWRVGVVIALVGFLAAWGLTRFLTPLSYGLCVAAVPFIVFYPSAKRWFALPQLVLAIAWGFAVLIPWSAVTGGLDASAWLLWGATLLWTLGFDTVYALADREDDERVGIRSSARTFGAFAPHAIGLCYLGTALLLALLGQRLGLHPLYWLSWGASLGLWTRQWWRLRSPLPRPVYTGMFGENVRIGFLLLLGMGLGLWLV